MTELGGEGDELVVVRNLTVKFGGITAVNGASIRVTPGETCALIGPNGAGKTTLFDAIAGQNNPAGGAIEYLGSDISARSPLWRSQHGIRRTFQRQQTFPGLTVEDNVLVALEWHDPNPLADLLGLSGRRQKERERRGVAEEILARVGLFGVRKEPAYRLTLGRSRLLELARAIAPGPRLLLLDEPTSGMEAADIDLLSEVLDRMKSEHQVGVLLVEHDVEFAMNRAQRVYAMNLGEVIAEGTPREIQTNEHVIRIYLGKVGEQLEDSNQNSTLGSPS